MQRVRQGSATKGYDRDFKLFLFAMAGMQAYQTIFVTLAKEVTDSLPFVTQIRDIAVVSATGNIVGAAVMLGWSYLGERYSRKALLVVAGFVTIAAFTLGVSAPSYPLLFTFVVISIAARTAFLALAPAILMDMTPAEKRGAASSAMGVVVLLGMAVGTVLPSFIVDQVGFRVPMHIVSGFAFTGLIALMVARLPKRGAQEKALADVLSDSVDYRRQLDWDGLVRALSVRSNRSLFLFYAVLMISLGGVGYYMFTILKEDYGMSATTTMLLVMAAQFPTVVGTAYWGPKSDRSVRQRPDGRIRTLITGGVLATLFRLLSYVVLPLYLISPWFLAVHVGFTMVAAWSNSMALLPIMDAIVGDTNPPELRSVTVSIRQLVGVVTSSIGIVLVGEMQSAQGTFTWAAIIFSAVGLLASLALVRARGYMAEEMAGLDRLMAERARELTLEQPA